MWHAIVNTGHIEAADDTLGPGYLQHSPALNSGGKTDQQLFAVLTDK